MATNELDESQSGLLGNPYSFQGRRLDPETGLYHFRNRQYDPATGSFASIDPSGVWRHGQGDGYSSFDGDPVNNADSMGLDVTVTTSGSVINLHQRLTVDVYGSDGQKTGERSYSFFIKGDGLGSSEHTASASGAVAGGAAGLATGGIAVGVAAGAASGLAAIGAVHTVEGLADCEPNGEIYLDPESTVKVVRRLTTSQAEDEIIAAYLQELTRQGAEGHYNLLTNSCRTWSHAMFDQIIKKFRPAMWASIQKRATAMQEYLYPQTRDSGEDLKQSWRN